MGRALFGEALLFFVPFVIFALFLLARRRNPIDLSAWSDQFFWLVVAGFLLVAGALIYAGIVAERQDGPFVPTHVENGRLVPGQFK